MKRFIFPAVLLPALAATPRGAQGPLSIEDAIRTAWTRNAGLAASEAQAHAARLDATVARDAMLPSVETSARAVVSNEPLMAFGLKLDEGRISSQDFDPARLNHPDAAGGVGFAIVLKQPLYSGGRISAARRAAGASAQAEAESHEARRQELAAEVVRAYFGARVADEAVRYAESALAQAQETERFVRARVAQQLLLESESLRATAFRAQRAAELAAARQQAESARSGLELLLQEPVSAAALASPVESETADDAPPRETGAFRAASLRYQAARAAGEAARGSLLPEVFLQAGAETLRSSFSQGSAWASAMIGARWELSLGHLHAAEAAEARGAAAAAAARWQGQNEVREASDARGAITAAESRIASAREGVRASEAARTLRAARHREGLLPLTDLLDAETGLFASRTLLLQGQLDARVARARLALATGQPVEGVTP